MSLKLTEISTALTAKQLDLTGDLGSIVHWREAAIAILDIVIGHQNIACEFNEIFGIAATGADNPPCRFPGWNLYFTHGDISLQTKKMVLPPDSVRILIKL